MTIRYVFAFRRNTWRGGSEVYHGTSSRMPLTADPSATGMHLCTRTPHNQSGAELQKITCWYFFCSAQTIRSGDPRLCVRAKRQCYTRTERCRIDTVASTIPDPRERWVQKEREEGREGREEGKEKEKGKKKRRKGRVCLRFQLETVQADSRPLHHATGADQADLSLINLLS